MESKYISPKVAYYNSNKLDEVEYTIKLLIDSSAAEIIDSCDEQGIVFQLSENLIERTTYCCAWYLSRVSTVVDPKQLVQGEHRGHTLAPKQREEDKLLVGCKWWKDNLPQNPRYRDSEVNYLVDTIHRFLLFAILKNCKPYPEPFVTWEEFEEEVAKKSRY